MRNYRGLPGHVLLACLGIALCLAGCKTITGDREIPKVTVEGQTGTWTADGDGITYRPPNGGQPPGKQLEK